MPHACRSAARIRTTDPKEIAGRVTEVGPAGDTALTGARVLASTTGLGGYAPTATLIPVDDRIGLPEAVALYRYGVTAQGLIRAAHVTAGDRVLDLAAAGHLTPVIGQRFPWNGQPTRTPPKPCSFPEPNPKRPPARTAGPQANIHVDFH
ncbi:hypothetical protein [Actinomadura opuntiae]|uniref:hypothetical protein n=1 Tax=Actinomadura sp. OS1-43 TaxID=604315 RepID=UPI00255A8821|nr:hypothetical protein [Actinomadura sp. OS1-43]MDL4821732.1 hypothetical protein [Actinomadura sp. OS1-43]